MARVKRAMDRIEQRPIEYHEQVRRNYLAQAEADPARYHLVRADRDVQEVRADVWAAVSSRMKR
jgi:dTMP kinase